MRLCFKTFCAVLLGNKKNKAVTKEKLCRALWDLLIPNYSYSYTASYLSLFANGKRNLPNVLKTAEMNKARITAEFNKLIEDYLSYDTEHLLNELTVLINTDKAINAQKRKQLTKLAENAELGAFLAELYIFVVENTENISGNEGTKTGKAMPAQTLLEKIRKTENNATLCKHALTAIETKDYFALSLSVGKMQNEVYLAKVLIAIARIEGYDPEEVYGQMFHETFSRMENHKYKAVVWERCLSEGYFVEHSEALVGKHIHELNNQLYLFRTLQLLVNKGLRNMAEKYSPLLTHKKYKKDFEEFLGIGS